MARTITPSIGAARGNGSAGAGEPSSVVLHPGPFLRQTLVEESARLEVSIEEFITFAVLYYLADLDTQRVAQRIRGSGSELERPPSIPQRPPSLPQRRPSFPQR